MRVPLTARTDDNAQHDDLAKNTAAVPSSSSSPITPSSPPPLASTDSSSSSRHPFRRNISRLRSSQRLKLNMFRPRRSNNSNNNATGENAQQQQQQHEQQQELEHQQQTSSSASSSPSSSPPRSSLNPSSSSRAPSVFNLGSGSGSRRSSTRSNEDAYITLSLPGRVFKSEIVTDDELRDGQRLAPARFKLVPVSESPAFKNKINDNSSSLNNNDTFKNPDVRQSSSSSSSATASSTFNQAGGHGGSFQMDGATLTKKVTKRETTFYEDALKGLWPVQLLPKYYGRVGDDAIRFENLTYGFKRPCVVDLKMGIQTVESDEKSLLKRIKMNTLDKVTGSRTEGCRLEGLSMFRTIDKRNVNVKGSKRQTHVISADVRVSLQDVLTFFLTDESGVRTDVALRFQTAIEQILKQFEKNDRFLFIGSSILLIYDNDNQSPHMRWARALRKLHTIAPNVRLSEDQISGLTRRTLCDVRMIDFAHTGPLPPGQVRDEGYIRGLRSVLKALKAIRVYRTKPIFSLRNAAIDMMEEQRARSLAAQVRGEQVQEGQGDFTFGAVLRELTAVSRLNDDNESV